MVGGHNYGQGSSREHAALAPYTGIKAVLAKSFARIHQANLINFGILPLTFVDEVDYDGIEKGDLLKISSLRGELQSGDRLAVTNLRTGGSFTVYHGLPRQKDIVLAGGLLNYTKNKVANFHSKCIYIGSIGAGFSHKALV